MRFMRVFYGLKQPESSISDPITSRDSDFEFEYYEPKINVLEKALPWVIAAGVLALCLLAILIGLIYGNRLDQTATPTSTPLLTTTYRQLATVGAACGVSSDCIPSAFCSGAICACAAQFYFDTASQTCTSRKTYGDTCSTSVECEYFVYLDCINGVCDCDSSTFFWNPVTQRCEDQRGLAQSCSGVSSSECFSSALSCVTYNGGPDTRCVCPTNQLSTYYSFASQTCTSRLGHGSQCNQYAHFECVDNAWCTTFPQDTTFRCSCYPTYYWDANTFSCRAKVHYNSSCTFTYQCFDYLGQACVSGRCGCPAGTFWNLTNCDPLKPYGGVCNKTSDCMYTGLICTFRPEQQDYGCLCPNGTYYSLATSSCTVYLDIGDLCVDNYECPINSTCTFQASTSDKRCTCATNFYYNVPTTNQCLPFKNYTDPCTNSFECNSLLGFYCNAATSQCDCAQNYYFNGRECQIQKGTDAHTYDQYCQNAFECKTWNGVDDCSEGRCF